MPRLIVHGFTISLAPYRFLVCLAVLVCGTVAQAQIDSTYIVAVDRLVHEIDAARDFEVRTLENEEFLEQMADGGGHLKGYVKNGQLVKMESWVGFSSCVNITEYYFDRGQLVFVQEQGLEFAYVDSTGSFDPDLQTVTMEGRYCFRDGVAAPVVLKGSTRCGGTPTEERSAMLSAEEKRLRDLLMR